MYDKLFNIVLTYPKQLVELDNLLYAIPQNDQVEFRDLVNTLILTIPNAVIISNGHVTLGIISDLIFNEITNIATLSGIDGALSYAILNTLTANSNLIDGAIQQLNMEYISAISTICAGVTLTNNNTVANVLYCSREHNVIIAECGVYYNSMNDAVLEEF